MYNGASYMTFVGSEQLKLINENSGTPNEGTGFA